MHAIREWCSGLSERMRLCGLPGGLFWVIIRVLLNLKAYIMTTTVKLPNTLEDSLRERCASEGRSISEVMRDALVMYLATAPKGVASAFELGQDLFGRSYGAGLELADLASKRKAYSASVWDEIAVQKMPGAEA